MGQEDPVEKGMATYSSILEKSMNRGAWQTTGQWLRYAGVTKHMNRIIIKFSD